MNFRIFKILLPVVGFFILGFGSPKAASAVTVQFDYHDPEFFCSPLLKITNDMTGVKVFEGHASIEPAGGKSIPMPLPQSVVGPGVYTLNLSLDSGEPLGTFKMFVVTTEEQFIFNVGVPPHIADICRQPNPDPGPGPEPIQTGTLSVCADGTAGDPVTVSVDGMTSPYHAEGTIDMSQGRGCLEFNDLPFMEYSVIATRGSNSQRQVISFSQANNSLVFVFRPPPDIHMTLTTPDTVDASSVDAQVGDSILIKLEDRNNPDVPPSFAKVYVNGASNRHVLMPLQFFNDGFSGFNSNQVVFLVDRRDAGLTLEITADAVSQVSGGSAADGAGPGRITPIPVSAVYVYVAPKETGGGNADAVREELLQIINDVQNTFNSELQYIRLEFGGNVNALSSKLDAVGNLPVKEGNMSSTLYQFLQQGGITLQGHFNHSADPNAVLNEHDQRIKNLEDKLNN